MSYLALAKRIRAGLKTETLRSVQKKGRAQVQDPSETMEEPLITPEDWWPIFSELHKKVCFETPEFDYAFLREHQPGLYEEIKTLENKIDDLGPARLSEVMQIMAEWRQTILRAQQLQATKVTAAK